MKSIAVDDYGWTSSRPSGSASYLYPPVLRAIRARSPRRILDLGCGNGHLAATLAELGYRVAAVDADARGIELGRKLAGTIDFRHLNLGDGPPQDFVDEPFDVIVSTEVVEHMFYPRQLFEFARRCLAPSGVLLVTTPYHGWLKNTLIGVLGKWDYHHQPGHEGGHIKFWSRRTMNGVASASGFRETAFWGCGRWPYLWKSMLVSYEPVREAVHD